MMFVFYFLFLSATDTIKANTEDCLHCFSFFTEYHPKRTLKCSILSSILRKKFKSHTLNYPITSRFIYLEGHVGLEVDRHK